MPDPRTKSVYGTSLSSMPAAFFKLLIAFSASTLEGSSILISNVAVTSSSLKMCRNFGQISYI